MLTANPSCHRHRGSDSVFDHLGDHGQILLDCEFE